MCASINQRGEVVDIYEIFLNAKYSWNTLLVKFAPFECSLCHREARIYCPSYCCAESCEMWSDKALIQKWAKYHKQKQQKWLTSDIGPCFLLSWAKSPTTSVQTALSSSMLSKNGRVFSSFCSCSWVHGLHTWPQRSGSYLACFIKFIFCSNLSLIPRNHN